MRLKPTLVQVTAGLAAGCIVWIAFGLAYMTGLSQRHDGVSWWLGWAAAWAILAAGLAMLALVGRTQRAFPWLGCVVAAGFFVARLRGLF